MRIDLLDFFQDELTQAILVRHGPGQNVGGKWVPGATTEIPIMIMEPQPIKPNELVKLEDGEHVRDFWKTWTQHTDIRTREDDNDADLIQWGGRTYQVTEMADRDPVGGYSRPIIKKVG